MANNHDFYNIANDFSFVNPWRQKNYTATGALIDG